MKAHFYIALLLLVQYGCSATYSVCNDANIEIEGALRLDLCPRTFNSNSEARNYCAIHS